MKREDISEDSCNKVIESIRKKIIDNMKEKGSGSFVSRHEISGAITEEYHELIEAVHSGSLKDIDEELQELKITVYNIKKGINVYKSK